MNGLDPEHVSLRLSSKQVLYFLSGIAFLLGFISGLGRLLRWYIWPPHTLGSRVAILFDVNLEGNVPAYYSSILILACVPLLLYVLAAEIKGSGRYTWHWAGLAALFIMLSLDEAIELHGMLNDPVARHLGTGDVIPFGWTIAAIIGLILLSSLYFRFFFSLPQNTQISFALAGFLYVMGAVGFELVAGFLVSDHFQASVAHTYALATLSEHVEELLEMIGMSLFLYALLRHVRDEYGGINLLVHLR